MKEINIQQSIQGDIWKLYYFSELYVFEIEILIWEDRKDENEHCA